MPTPPRFFTALALLFAPLALAVEPPSTLKRTDQSPSGDFRIEHRHDADSQYTMWLISARDPKVRTRLFKPDYGNARDPDLHISADEKCIARTQLHGSTRITVYLHRRTGPLAYRQAGDLAKPVWRFVEKSFGLPDGELHTFRFDLEAVRWIDSTRLLLHLKGGSPVEPKFAVTDFHCVYHTDTKTFSVLPEHKESNAKALWRESDGE